MTIPAPDVNILEQLSSQGSIATPTALKKALRVWLIYASIHRNTLSLSAPFTYTQWHTAAIADRGLLQGKLTDIYQATIADYLTSIGDVHLPKWIQDYCDRYQQTADSITQRLQARPFQLRTQNPSSQKRALENDFLFLSSPGGFLQDMDQHGDPIRPKTKAKQARYYRPTLKRLTPVPSAQPQLPVQSHVLNGRYKHVDLRELLVTFAQPIQAQQRFFLDLDNVVAIEDGQNVSAIAQFLKTQVWPQTPVPPIAFTYHSRSQNQHQRIITYPVCLYYYQRAPYLIAFGQSPQPELPAVTWYCFRAERITSPQCIQWSSPEIPEPLQQAHRQHRLPAPDQIINDLESAWGFEIGSPKEPVLLRFMRPYHDQYIDRSNRHETFQLLKTRQEQEDYLMALNISPTDRHRLLTHLTSHPHDAYYRAIARRQDNSLVMRLRAWGPNVEVLYPFHLRDRMAREIQQTFALYHACP